MCDLCKMRVWDHDSCDEEIGHERTQEDKWGIDKKKVHRVDLGKEVSVEINYDINTPVLVTDYAEIWGTDDLPKFHMWIFFLWKYF